ncbi:hypothetical protein [Modestobacter sp. SSW1-42]|uniref:hypothetical protein n=1 Tax=Modestobacter sp. SSW1-42 TaxID=596372 RepID=UPI00398735DF
MKSYLTVQETQAQAFGRRGRAGVVLASAVVGLIVAEQQDALGAEIVALAIASRAVVMILPVMGLRAILGTFVAALFAYLLFWPTGAFRADLVVPLSREIGLSLPTYGAILTGLVGTALVDWLELRLKRRQVVSAGHSSAVSTSAT